MPEIDTALVKLLRDKTGIGIMDCKKALAEAHGDLGAAVAWLRDKGIEKAARKAQRPAAEGVVGVMVAGFGGAIVELNAETDFVARNEAFQKAAASLTKIALDIHGDREAMLRAPAPDGEGCVSDFVTRLIAMIGENIHLRRSAFVSVSNGVVAAYTHNAVAPGLGSIGVLLALESMGEADPLAKLGRELSMHIAASAPTWITIEDIPPEIVVEKRATLAEEAMGSGKPASIVEKIVEGRMRKFYEEVVLVTQTFALDTERTVEQVIKEAEKKIGASIKVKAFVRMRRGEGLEPKAEN